MPGQPANVARQSSSLGTLNRAFICVFIPCCVPPWEGEKQARLYNLNSVGVSTPRLQKRRPISIEEEAQIRELRPY